MAAVLVPQLVTCLILQWWWTHLPTLDMGCHHVLRMRVVGKNQLTTILGIMQEVQITQARRKIALNPIQCTIPMPGILIWWILIQWWGRRKGIVSNPNSQLWICLRGSLWCTLRTHITWCSLLLLHRRIAQSQGHKILHLAWVLVRTCTCNTQWILVTIWGFLLLRTDMGGRSPSKARRRVRLPLLAILDEAL